MPTIGRTSGTPTSEPQYGAFPDGNTLPSRAAIQYDVWSVGGVHALGAGGGGPEGPAIAVTPLFVPMSNRPSAADGDAKCGTAPSATVMIVAPLAGLRP